MRCTDPNTFASSTPPTSHRAPLLPRVHNGVYTHNIATPRRPRRAFD
uniref:Uncharacterized protein n=1 Tax=viral metagenome TaxID=1070528 RepID=A0A6C0AT51_9ZZZZ